MERVWEVAWDDACVMTIIVAGYVMDHEGVGLGRACHSRVGEFFSSFFSFIFSFFSKIKRRLLVWLI